MVAVPTSALPRDAIRMYMPRGETLPTIEEAQERARRAPVVSSIPLPDPIKGTNRNAVENATHLVKDGETIETTYQRYVWVIRSK